MRAVSGRVSLCLALLVTAACARDVPAEDRTPPDEPAAPGVQQRPWMGDLLFVESFEDADLEARGWYDTDERLRLTGGRFECRFARGATECGQGTPGRHGFAGVEEIYVGYRVRYSDDWVGSGRPYHPHELYLLTNLDDRWAGPSWTHLTIYLENVDLHGQVAIQDGRNVDVRCILRNDDAVEGCAGGSPGTFAFGENRSVAACNGLAGPVQIRDCYPLGDGRWSSARAWRTDAPALAPAGGDDGWHHVELYLRLNRIVDGRAVPDGAIRYAIDGEERLALDSLLFRTGRHAHMRVDQLIVAPYIGDGSPIDQTMWLDDLVVARGRRP